MTTQAPSGAAGVASGDWDLAVVGAGPAGATLSRQAAIAGARVLVIDRHRFPRPKVCGGCLSALTVGRLSDLGLGDTVANLGGAPLRTLRVGGWGRSADLPLPGGVSVSRALLDQALLDEAMMAGATFLPEHHVTLGAVDCRTRSLQLRGPGGARRTVRASVVVDATGLGGLLDRGLPRRRGKRPRVGCSVTIDDASLGYESGTIYMAVGCAGYVGLTRDEQNRLNVAAALDPAVVRSGGPGRAAQTILATAGMPPISDLSRQAWGGTPELRRTPRERAAERLFVVGDAAGYVEPFTGEGIGWAIHSAALLAPLSVRAAERWSESLAHEWTATYRAELCRSQLVCRAASALLGVPIAARVALRMLRRRPGLGRPFVRRAHGPPLGSESVVWG